MLSAPGRHARDQAADLQARVHPAVPGRADVLSDQLVQPGALGEGHHRHQAGVRHEIRVVERRAVRARLCNNRTYEVSSRIRDGSLDNSHSPSSEGTFRIPTPKSTSNSSVD